MRLPHPGSRTTLALAALVATSACRPAEREAGGQARAAADGGAVQVVARDYSLQAPDTIPSGWATFRFENQGKETHFFVLHQMPEGIDARRYIQGAAPPFDSAMKLLRAGGSKAEAGQVLVAGLPAWFADVHEMGGAGLVAPGGSTTVTEKLAPGTYIMECYVKNAEGTFHGMLGMIHQLTVTEDTSTVKPPEADLEITLSDSALEGPDRVAAGPHTVAVRYASQPPGLVGHDVHVVRLGEGQSLDDVAPWMDWMNVGGLKSPAPATFLGGVQEMPAGNTAYFTVDLEPGHYTWISELGAEQGMARPFTVE